MKRFKVIRDREALSSNEIAGRMNFDTFISGYTKYEVTAQNTIFNKGRINIPIVRTAILVNFFLAIAIIVLSVFIYKVTTEPVLKSNTAPPVDSTKKLYPAIHDQVENSNKKSNSDISDAVNNHSKQTTIIISNKNSYGAINGNKILKNRQNEIADSLINDSEKYKILKLKRCVIWIPANYCSFPKSAIFANSIKFGEVEPDYVDCQAINKMDGVSCIWVSIAAKKESILKIEDQLKNFTLLKGKNKTYYPFLIKMSNDTKALQANFKGKNLKVHYDKQIDIFLFFKNADPKIGEKFRVNDLTTTITR